MEGATIEAKLEREGNLEGTQDQALHVCPDEAEGSCRVVVLDGVPHLRIGPGCDLWRFFHPDEERPPASLCLDSHRNAVQFRGHEAYLTSTEFRVVQIVATAQGVCTYTMLSRGLWGISPSRARIASMRDHVLAIRKKLDAAGLPDLIEQVWGEGVRLAPWVR
ncbi:MAG TPA: winged helix-turn-helix domain-containing protein [Dehalococcoidia bacterium]|nr:winged helix-turn-helix domain-containing protein [Dehalococcoidia bacterium]